MEATKRKHRKSNGSGSIRQRPDGTWEARYISGRDPATGKPVRKSIYAKSKSEIREKLTSALASVANGTHADSRNLTAEQWFNTWLNVYCKHLGARTAVMYRGFLNDRIIPALGGYKLNRLTAPTIQMFYNHLSEELAPKTVKNIHGIVHKALQQATILRYISHNPADNAVLPRVEKTQIKPLSNDEMQAFLSASEQDSFHILYKVALFTGLRLGELRGLTWDRIDFDNGSILIDRQLQCIDKTHTFTPPKHNKLRQIFPAPFVMDALRKQYTQQLEMKMRAGSAWDNPNGFVFTNEKGRYLLSDNIYRHFKDIAREIGRSDARFHDLRHTFACVALKAGVDAKTLSETLGHHSVAFTLDVYAFALDEMKKVSAQRIGAYLQDIV